jgi:hypothetical protein
MEQNRTGFPLGKNVTGGIVGNILEWYDFAVFGYFAPLGLGLVGIMPARDVT